MAGFEVTLNGRFWVTPEAVVVRRILIVLLKPIFRVLENPREIEPWIAPKTLAFCAGILPVRNV